MAVAGPERPRAGSTAAAGPERPRAGSTAAAGPERPRAGSTAAVTRDRTARLRSRIGALLDESRTRTLALADVPDAEQLRQVSPLMSPLVWDLAHVANYEELWLLRAVDGRLPVDGQLDDLYNAFEHPRWERPSLPILGPADARDYATEVRSDVHALLEEVDLGPHADPLVAHGFVYGMVVQHEHQHCETMLATHQLRGEGATPPDEPVGPDPDPVTTSIPSDRIRIDGGRFTMGTSTHPWAYDNERPAHESEVSDFLLDRHPVTCGQHIEFIEAGGYDDPTWWSEAGWQWREEEGATAPLFWRPAKSGWEVLRFGDWQPVRPDEPVQHVCHHEAEAHAAWAGGRLPTEAEWEYAATWHPERGKRRHPWGDEPPTAERANLGGRHRGPAPVGSYPRGTNPWGVHQLVGDVWEWTASPFEGYPGFRPFPYREYSEVFFGDDHRVLRGASWAVHPLMARATFRNWDLPVRRQIFAGFRCAADA